MKMKRIKITQKNGNLNINVLVKLTEYDVYDSLNPMFEMPSQNVYCKNVIDLFNLKAEEIDITQDALDAIKNTTEDIFSDNVDSAFFILNDSIKITFDKKYFNSLGLISNLDNLNICIKKLKYGYKRNALFNVILNKIKFKELVKDF
jgi:Mg2+ and Co2+ transporter CorA